MSQEEYTFEDAITDFRQGLGERLRALRESRNWTLKQLSQSTGLSLTYLSDLERGRTLPSIETLLKISLAYDLKVSISWGAMTFGESE